MRATVSLILAGAAFGALAAVSTLALVRAEFAITRADQAVQSSSQSGVLSPSDEERLVAKATDAALAALRSEDVLGPEIKKGIAAYVQEQRQAQQEARAQAQSRADEQAKNVRPVSAERDHIRGSADATVSLIEYSDFECPYCKRYHSVAKEVVASFGEQANWVYRHLPLDMHNPGAQKQAEAAECAAELGGNEAFWRLTDTIFERTRSGGSGLPLDDLAPLAAEIGLDQAAFQDCIDSERMAARVQEDIDEAKRLGVGGTPHSILRNNDTGEVKVVRGAATAATLKAAIESLL